MKIVQISEFQEEFVIYFGSEQKIINAYTLASSLVSLADAAKEANYIINPGYEIEVVVEALSSGSFKAQIKTIYKGLDNLFTKENLKVIVLGIIASYIYQQTLAPDLQINVNVDNKQVIIEQEDKKIIIPRNVYDALKKIEKSNIFKRNISQTFNAVENDEEITSFGITKNIKDDKPSIEIDRSQFALIQQQEVKEDNSREITEIADLQILRAILERAKRRWEFVWRGIKISAPVLDNKFYDDFFAHRITIAPGDSLEVIMKIFQVKDPDTGIYTNLKYEIVEVKKHIPRVKQITANL